jgi:hypothetical protein
MEIEEDEVYGLVNETRQLIVDGAQRDALLASLRNTTDAYLLYLIIRIAEGDGLDVGRSD